MTQMQAWGERPASYSELVAAEIRAWMGRRGVNQTRLSNELGWTQMYLSRRLTGRQAVDVDDLAKIARVLRCSVSDLLPRLDSNQQPSGYRSSEVSSVVGTVVQLLPRPPFQPQVVAA